MNRWTSILFLIMVLLLQGCSNGNKPIDYGFYDGKDIIELIKNNDIQGIEDKYEDNSFLDKNDLKLAIEKVINMGIDSEIKFVASTTYKDNEIANIAYDGVDIHVSPFTKIERELIYNLYSFEYEGEEYLINISYYRDGKKFIPLGFNTGMVTLKGQNGQEYLEESQKLYQEGKLIPSMKYLITAYELSSNLPNMFIGDKDQLISYKLDLEKTINLSYSFPARYDFNGKSIVVMGISFGDNISRDLFVITYNTKQLISTEEEQIMEEAKSFHNVIGDYYPGLENEEYRLVFRVFDVTGKGEVITIEK